MQLFVFSLAESLKALHNELLLWPWSTAWGDYVTIKVSSAVITLIFWRCLCLTVLSFVWTLHCLRCQFLSRSHLFCVSVFPVSFFSFPGGGLKQAVQAVCVCHDQLRPQCGYNETWETQTPAISAIFISRFLAFSHTDFAFPLFLGVFFLPSLYI